MMDVSDGLLIDAARMAAASGCAVAIELEFAAACPTPFWRCCGEARLEAASAGDDYELLFAADPARAPAILALAEEIGLPLSRIGRFDAGAGLSADRARRARAAARAARLRAWLN